MHRMVATTANTTDKAMTTEAPVYWLRVLTFSAGATIKLGLSKGKALVVLGFYGHVAPLGAPYDGIELTGDVTVEYSTRADEPYPGPSFPAGA